jgi:hypothetical protein
MPLRHPPLTWDQVAAWALANEISDDITVCNQEGELLHAVRGDQDLWLAFGGPRDQAFTWGRLKEAVMTEIRAPGSARLIFDDPERGANRVVDLSESSLAVPGLGYDEIPVFVLQRRWG